ncbi:MAG: GTPase HflX [Ruminococcaceae bacterium]|nr:GTPase HflX [Oscillospiraceae bacterium]
MEKQEAIFRSVLSDSEPLPQAVLVSVFPKGKDKREHEASLEELRRLTETAGAEVFAVLVQERDNPDPATYIGSGKLEELETLCHDGGVELVILDDDLSPSKIRNLEDALPEGVRVIDRSMLILDIFALHAATADGKLQVELAQLKYTAPRLTGRGKDMSRLGGGIGTRGPGESKLESDRRHMRSRIAALETELENLRKNREIQRNQRSRSGVFKVAIAGYTNAGKSTLLNRLTDAGILAEDKLFATLDPTTRQYILPSGKKILLTDTVGFIRNLPTHLIKAFRSTLDEVCYADALIIVADSSDPECESQLRVTDDLLLELGAKGKPTLYLMNKCDKESALLPSVERKNDRILFVSALTGRGMAEVIGALEELASSGKEQWQLLIPQSKLGLVSELYGEGTVLNVEYTAEGAKVSALLDGRMQAKCLPYKVD